MTGLQAYVLAKKIAIGAVSGIANITIEGDQLVFHFTDGSSASMAIPLPQEGPQGDPGKDGLSIIDVKIDTNNHLICTLSDYSEIDAGELPIGAGGGLMQVNSVSNLITPGKDNIIYLVLEDEALYYWDTEDSEYKLLTIGSSEELVPIDFKTHKIVFDGIEDVFNLPVDDKVVNIYVNGVYLTEDEDYTIDRNVTPNQVTFLETWDDTDICTITWIEGTASSGNGDIKITLATKEDIDKMFSE